MIKLQNLFSEVFDEVKSMKKCVVIIPARNTSTRLPLKHLQFIGDRTMLSILATRMQHISEVDQVIIATTNRSCDDSLCEEADRLGCDVFRGSHYDVLGRFAQAARSADASIVIKANGDNPLLAPEVIEQGIEEIQNGSYEFVTGKKAYTLLPVGIGAEVMSMRCVDRLDKLSREQSREDITLYLFENKGEFDWAPITITDRWKMPNASITVDTPRDFRMLKKIILRLPKVAPEHWTIEQILEQLRLTELSS
tara:strand:+ start:603 stop:1358 length:756 start_codon:yes stop_codon:yes gene_type:complete